VQQPGALAGAAPANDLLWGDAGADRFVFTSGPVGHDTILDFNPALSGELVEISKALGGVENFADLYNAISDNADGNAILTLADGDTITFDKISKAQLGSNDLLIV
jgi:Ca2+-binding RTX toxin-like protein